VKSGGGFDDEGEILTFRIPGTVVRRIRKGNPHCYSVTEFDVPTDD